MIKKIQSRLSSLSMFRYLSGIINFLKAMIPVSSENFDKNPYLVAFQNGVADLQQSFFGPLLPTDMITQTMSVSFSESATCPNWLNFINTIFASNEELVAFIQRVIGYCLSGCTDADAVFFLYGTGANGKSTFRCALEMLFGEYAGSVAIDALLDRASNQNNNDYQKARLKGKRIVFTDEVPARAFQIKL